MWEYSNNVGVPPHCGSTPRFGAGGRPTTALNATSSIHPEGTTVYAMNANVNGHGGSWPMIKACPWAYIVVASIKITMPGKHNNMLVCFVVAKRNQAPAKLMYTHVDGFM